MLLVDSPRTRAIILGSVAVSMAIIYWLISLRTSALDITYEPIFLGLFLFQDYALALACFLVLLLSLWAPLRRIGLRCVIWVSHHVRLVSVVYLVVLAAGAMFVYHAHPLSMDEYAPYFQSQVFAEGNIVGRLPPELLDWLIPPQFQNYFLNISQSRDSVLSAYWPGFALLLAPFTFFGVPWLCNPVIGAFSILLIHRLAKTLYGQDLSAGLATLLAMAAPAFAVNSMSFYSMTAHLTFNVAFVLFLLAQTPRRAFLAGIVGSIALSLHNPVPHALFAAPWVIWLALGRRWRVLGALIAGYAPLTILLGFGWVLLSASVLGSAATYGDPLWEAWLIRIVSIFNLPDAELLRARLIGIAKLWVWAVPASLIAACVGYWNWRKDYRVSLLACSAVLTFLGYLLVPFDQGHGWGFRYFHSAWFVIPILAAGAVSSAGPADKQHAIEPRATAGYLAACGVLSLCLVLPLAMFQVETFISRHLAQLPTAEKGTPKLILVHADTGYYAADLVQNDPYARNEVLILFSLGRNRDQAMLREHFPGLVQLARDRRGSVWGLPDENDDSRSGASIAHHHVE